MNYELKDLLNYIEVPIFVLEPDQSMQPIYVAMNSAACHAGKLELANVIGKTAIEIYPGRFGERAYEHHKQVLHSAEQRSYELVLPVQDHSLHIRTSLKPITNTEGKVIRIVGTSALINEEIILRETQATTLALNGEIEHFISLAAHDLRTPIRNVKALTDLLRKDFQDLGDGKLELIGMLENVANKAISLIGNIISHAQATGTTESIEDFDLADLCHEIFTMLDPTSFHSADVSSLKISGDKIATQIALRNLIDNAFKHNSTPINLKISARQQDSVYIQVKVSDDGVGIENPESLFSTAKSPTIDSGFGLMGIRRLIKTRGGTITARHPDQGRGAEILFSIPGKVLSTADE